MVTTDPAYPMVDERSYTPPIADPQAYLSMLDRTGMARGVLIQISVNGTDNRYMLETVNAHHGRLRGVAVVDPEVPESELHMMARIGIRGTRLNVLFGGGVGFDGMERIAAKIAPLGWHLQLLVDARQLPELTDRIAKLPIPVVIDHMGHMPAEEGTDTAGFQAMLGLVRDHGAWVKLSGAYRIDPDGPHYPAAKRLAQALFEAAPGQLVYGSDWPHVAPPYGPMPDTGELRNWLWEAADNDEDLVRRILVDNPQALYGFAPMKEES